MVGWVSPESSRRSSWDIIWLCFSVFLLCSWKCTHLNIPSLEESRGEWHQFSIWKISVAYFPKTPARRRFFRKAWFMVLMCLAPEVIVAMATMQYVNARADLIDVNSRFQPSDANGPKREKKAFTMAHAHWARMGGFTLVGIPSWPSGNFIVAELTAGVVFLRDMGLVEVDDIDIQDHSKADGFTKILAIVQAGWLVVQSIAREVAGVQIAELELMTMAFVMCALVTYILWWDKPFDADGAIVISCPEDKRDETLDRPISRAPPPVGKSRCDSIRISDLKLSTFVYFVTELYGSSYIPSLAFFISATAFSAVHLIAWNWVFPHPVLQFLWRLACVDALGSTLAPIIFQWIYAVSVALLEECLPSDKCNGVLLFATDSVLMLVNIVSRGVLIYLTFNCFTLMPEAVYSDLDWTKFVPHFS
ncbi:hypothetical protein GQ53DRAFT_867693 [Thozetella sp. PMI_491]|nr:hypothetical protein GQ53DRAFT_867693 [Thozetella sp. PMI_491]